MFKSVEKAFMCLMVITMVQVSHAQSDAQAFLDAHNAARAQVGVGGMTWDSNVAGYAQNYANQMSDTCKMVHSGGRYGENLAWGSPDLSATDAVNMWVGERQFYNYNSNSCSGGECLHYTQVVWRNSVRLGCARVGCNSGGTFVICSYDPPGNYIGERPY
ncbi:hypothetical protein ACHQM5_024252 [Ranunculus cassubicifolius]